MRLLHDIRTAAEQELPVSGETALDILTADAGDLPDIMVAATALRLRRFGNRIRLCSIVNAKSGACPENCAYCAQSVHNRAKADVFALMSGDRILTAYKDATSLPIRNFGVVTSGPALDEDGLRRIATVVNTAEQNGVAWCASLGALDVRQLKALKAAGLTRFHHNLETAESFFSEICSTHTYAERLATVRAAREAGLEVCSGGILGMGETLEQRVELAMALAREKVDSIPLNFLTPITGTRLENMPPMQPLDILKSIAMFRMTNPRAEIKVCAGRAHLQNLQSMIFYAGATGIMIGSLLTIAGCDVQQDLQMLENLGLKFND